MTIHKEGYRLITSTVLFLACLLFLAYYFLGDYPVAIIGTWVFSSLFFLIILQFFRKPDRSVATVVDGQVLCPADGKVVVIEEVHEPEFFKDQRIQVSVFMSPLNVHINWAPISGIIKYVKYHPGLFLVAWHPKSSTENERTTMVLESPQGVQVLIRQIAGALARRIVYFTKEGDEMRQGSEVGFIKFGSRVDIFLPIGTEIKVTRDQKVTGNRTVLAELKSS